MEEEGGQEMRIEMTIGTEYRERAIIKRGAFE